MNFKIKFSNLIKGTKVRKIIHSNEHEGGIDSRNSGLLLIDLQEKLLKVIPHNKNLHINEEKLARNQGSYL